MQPIDGFHPHGLPDARHGGVVDPPGFEDLLAARLAALVGGVGHLDDDLLRSAAADQIGDVERKGVVAALVTARLPAVYPHHGRVIHRPEVEQDTPAVPCGGDIERSPVPEFLGGQERALHARQRRFDAERHQNLSVGDGRCGSLGRGHGVIPQSVEVLPLGTHQLRARVFGQRTARIDLIRPAGFDLVTGGPPLGRSRRGDEERSGKEQE